MSGLDVSATTMLDVRDAIAEGRATCREIIDGYLDRIERLDSALQCYREVFAQSARRRATEIDGALARGERPGPLAGVPIAVKDNIVGEEGASAAGSRMLESFRSPYTATALARLLDAGAIVLGRTNCDEFGMGSSNEHCAFEATRNPWDADFVPGGSSGGSAAAVVAGLCGAAIGSDTGGSIRQPAAFCGVVGLKPTYGRVSRWGLVAFASSLEQIGPIARTAADAAAILDVIAGHDPRDSTSVDDRPPTTSPACEQPIDRLRVGVVRGFARGENHPEVNRAVERAADVYADLGAKIVDVELPLNDYGVATYYILAPAEASSNLARYDGVRYGRRVDPQPGETINDLYARSRAEGFGPEVRRRIMLGTYVLSAGYYEAYYDRAMRVRRLIRDEFARAFERCDVILGPVAPTPAFPMGAAADPLAMYLTDYYTVNANIAGHPAISLPAGMATVERMEDRGARSTVALPLGVQLQAPPFEELRLLRAARMYERAAGHSGATPPVD